MFEVMVEKQFSAAHHLLNYEGQCENPHGHNFVVRLWAQKQELDQANIAFDYKVLKKELSKIVDDELDHIDLNEHPPFAGESPSSEFLARYIYKRMKQVIPEVSKVCVYETPTACAFYYE